MYTNLTGLDLRFIAFVRSRDSGCLAIGRGRERKNAEIVGCCDCLAAVAVRWVPTVGLRYGSDLPGHGSAVRRASAGGCILHAAQDICWWVRARLHASTTPYTSGHSNQLVTPVPIGPHPG